MVLIPALVQRVSALVSAKPGRCRRDMSRARWLKTDTLLFASFAAALVLIVPPDAWASIFSFNCGQVFGVNGTTTYNVVGFQSVSKNYAGFQVDPNTVMGSCGVTLNVPGAVSTFPRAISPDGFVTGEYNDSAKVRHGFVMRIAPNNTSGNLLSFNANALSGDANATLTSPMGISVSSGNNAWVVGFYLTNNGHSSHAFAVQVNTNNAPPTIVGGSWISFDVSAAGSGIARGVDGADPNSVIVGSYPDASGKQQGYVLKIADLKAARAALNNPRVTVVTTSYFASVTCSGAIGGYIHGISDVGRIVGIAFTSNMAGYAYYVDGIWTKGNTYQPVCNQVPVPGASKSGQTWASGISSDGTWIVGQGGGADWVYQP